MTVISVKALNFKKLRNVDVKLNGKSFFLVGDTKEGKSTFLKIIMSTLMIEDFPTNPLSDGADKGEIEVVHELNGIKYTVKRSYPDNQGKNGRFTVTDQNGGRHTLTTLLDTIFGKAFTNSFFNYNEYFHVQKSPEARYNYFVKAIGGDQVVENNQAIARIRKQRGLIGTERDKYQAIIDHSSLNPETLEEDLVYYNEEKTTDEVIKKRDELLLTRKSITNLNAQLSVVKDGNSAYEMATESLTGIDDEILDLEKRLTELKTERELVIKWQTENPADFDRQKELEQEIATAEEFNTEVEKKANDLYDDGVREVTVFNQMHNELHAAIKSYNEYLRCDKEWNEKDAEILELLEENKSLFKNKINVNGLSVEEGIVMYNGKEFSYDNLSTGESLRLAMEIQRSLNPAGNNLIAIPNALLLGSDLDEILEECKKMDIQAMVEITERKQKFEIKFEEDYK